ncbi:hypothetical protein K435DRAFT_807090 [Dendrothele bispora CBS 962.96]|uniref:Uncharacterized protein n=1 Tax=Dendrothele bispora (strain CBS 962.96) TaxID=1314807 RepID=A0A4S8L5T0_DENBC|nr:hypothetical protein K435DRAFT_807090 [Dendrothele bispora CBS 962.96]
MRTSTLFATLLVSLLSSSVYGSPIPVASDSNDSIQLARDVQSLEERSPTFRQASWKREEEELDERWYRNASWKRDEEAKRFSADWKRDEEEAKRFNADWKRDEEAKRFSADWKRDESEAKRFKADWKREEEVEEKRVYRQVDWKREAANADW